MRSKDDPMPLSELPGYMRGVRERGQGDDVPVVDIGMIVDSSPPSRWVHYTSAACLLVALCGVVSYGFASTRRITIVASQEVGSEAIADMVKDEGGRVVSVRKEEGGYEVRVFTLRGIGSFLDGLRRNDEIESADLAE